MELRQLRSFITLGEELHFGRAATRLHLAQSALSRQIQQLEEELKFLLFSRTKRRVELTSAGVVFFDKARSVFARVHDAVEAASRVANGQTGWLSIGFVGSAIYGVFPAIIRSFRQSSPAVELILSEMTSAEQLVALREKRVHVGFLRPPVGGEELAVETVVHEPLAVALPSHNPLARSRTLPLRALAREPFIVFPPDPKAHWAEYVVSLCRQAGFEPQIVQKVIEMQTAISLVSAGLGITLVPASAKNIPWKEVVYRKLTAPNPAADLVVSYRHDDLSPVLRKFLLTVRKAVRKV
jgi:DNA-binding transcriptional LysR family regulator